LIKALIYTIKMVEIFKTNVIHYHQSILLVEKLKYHFPTSHINFDLEDCDRILRIEDAFVPVEETVRLMNLYGYDCEVLH